MNCDNCGKEISSWKARYGASDTVFCPKCFGTQEADEIIKNKERSPFNEKDDFLNHIFVDGVCKKCGWSRNWAIQKNEECPVSESQENSRNYSKSRKETNQKEEKEYQSTNEFRKNSDASKYGKILGLEGKVTIKDSKKSYRDLSKKYHPDRVSNLGIEFSEIAEKKMKEINEAYDWFRKRTIFNSIKTVV